MLLLVAFLGCGKKPELPKSIEKPSAVEMPATPEAKEAPKTLSVEAMSLVGTFTVTMEDASNPVTTIYASCGDYRQEQSISDKKVVFTEVPEESTCKLKFAPSGAGFAGAKAGTDLTCIITDGPEISCK